MRELARLAPSQEPREEPWPWPSVPADAQVHGSCAPKLALGPEGLAPRGHQACLFRNPWPSGRTLDATPRTSQPFLQDGPCPRGWDPPVSDPILGPSFCSAPCPGSSASKSSAPAPGCWWGCLLPCLPPVDTQGPRSRCPSGSNVGGSPEPGA